MKGLIQRNAILVTAAIAVLVALAATGYAIAGHGDDAAAAQPLTYMSIPF